MSPGKLMKLVLGISMVTVVPALAQVEAQDIAPKADLPCSIHQEKGRQALKQETLKGRIADVRVEELCMGARNVLQWKLKAETGEFWINVGPTAFVDDRKFPFALGDEVTVKGTIHEVDTQKVVVAYEIDRNGSKLTLRDAKGRPAWAMVRHGIRGAADKPAH